MTLTIYYRYQNKITLAADRRITQLDIPFGDALKVRRVGDFLITLSGSFGAAENFIYRLSKEKQGKKTLYEYLNYLCEKSLEDSAFLGNNVIFFLITLKDKKVYKICINVPELSRKDEEYNSISVVELDTLKDTQEEFFEPSGAGRIEALTSFKTLKKINSSGPVNLDIIFKVVSETTLTVSEEYDKIEVTDKIKNKTPKITKKVTQEKKKEQISR